jgi:hypothetical protein
MPRETRGGRAYITQTVRRFSTPIRNHEFVAIKWTVIIAEIHKIKAVENRLGATWYQFCRKLELLGKPEKFQDVVGCSDPDSAEGLETVVARVKLGVCSG